ncbi:MAG TPA: SgcJ/EcaC family oxidoreductase [Acidobacteriota bacterium]|nr:SgcJ/EcaC family oxidoreductase [Acidobacteriota bacterium]
MCANTNNEAQIRALVEQWVSAVREKNVEAILSLYAKDALFFDLAPPLRYSGIQAYRKSLEDWFRTFEVGVDYEIRDLRIIASDDVAFTDSLNHMTGKRTDGEDTDVWLRATIGFRKIDGKWLVVHEHVSVPFYMDGSYRAAVDLKP